MATVVNTKIGLSRNVSRIWIEGQKLSREGIAPAMVWTLVYQNQKLKVRIYPVDQLPQNSQFDKTGAVSIRRITKRDGTIIEQPLIEIRDNKLQEAFNGLSDIRISISNRVLTVSLQKNVSDAVRRLERLKAKLSHKEPLKMVSTFHGGGVLDKAWHHGLKSAGVDSYVAMAIEMAPEYLDSSLRNNPELWREDSIIIESGIEQINLCSERIPEMDILVAGIPCCGESLSGKAKNKIKNGEDHAKAGAMFFYFLMLAIATNPAILQIENVPTYATSLSMSVIRNVLTARGYVVTERVCGGNEFGALEDRQRLCVIAVTAGMESIINLDDVTPLRTKENRLGDVLEPISTNSARYKTYDYLTEKAIRDKEAGKGFALQLVTPDSPRVLTIGKGYAKARSTEPFLAHPSDPDRKRLLTPIEHSRVKTIPEEVTDGNSDTVAHEILGQSIVYVQFYAVAAYVGLQLMRWHRGELAIAA